MKKKIASLVLSMIVMLSAVGIVPNVWAEQKETEKTFFCADSKAFAGTGEYHYNDNFFENSAYIYNQDLSKMSMRMSLAAFNDCSVEYELQSGNIKNLLEQMDFGDIETNASYKEMSTSDSVGVITGNKEIQSTDGKYTLIAVVIRGGNYGKEWGGNFNVGKGEEHEGFRIAREQVLSHITKYIQSLKVKGDIKIWITGYSRGAAVANLTAAYLNTHETHFGSKINVKPENIYAYCFETPRGTTAEDRNDAIYNNIYSIVNRNDFVPMMAPKAWGFGRYGTTYYLPSEKTHDNYSELSSRMYKFYDAYVTDEYRTNNKATIESFSKYELAWTADGMSTYGGFYFKNTGVKENIDEFYRETLDILIEKIGNRETYADEFQESIVYFMENVLGSDSLDEFTAILTEEFSKRLNISSLLGGGEESSDVVFNALKATMERLQIKTEDKHLKKISGLIGGVLLSGKMWNLVGNAEMLEVVHYPELCMSWLDATNESDYTVNLYEIILKIDDTEAKVNGKTVSNDVAPIIRNDRTMLPARFVVENLGAEVVWDAELKTVNVNSSTDKICITIGSQVAKVNGEDVQLDSSAFIENDRTYVPVRFICENLGAEVEWNEVDKTVTIIQK